MVSFLMRAARNASAASRTARSEAAASTCAARSAAGAAAADPSHQLRSGLVYEARDGSPRDSGVSSPDKPPESVVAKVSFVAEKDLKSDEAMWVLYERWRKCYNQEREPDEMARRFEEFKRRAHFVHEVNNSNLPYKLELNQFSDGKLAETCLLPPGVGMQMLKRLVTR